MSLKIEGAYDPTPEPIERDFEEIKALGITEDEMRGASSSKLVNDEQFDDAIYKIASAAIFSQILGSGPCKLEHPLGGSAISPDVAGEWQCRRTRFEVTPVDDMPARYEPEALPMFTHSARRAASRAAWTAGSNRAVSTAIIVINTRSSMNVRPR